MLLEQVPRIKVNYRDAGGRTPLMWACSVGSVQCVQKLLAWRGPRGEKVKLDLRSRKGYTAIAVAHKFEQKERIASSRQRFKEVERLLISAGSAPYCKPEPESNYLGL